jgi:hypothetical protein
MQQVRGLFSAATHSGLATTAQLARLVVESQKAFANEPLPIGILIKDALGGETVTVVSLAEGTEVSLGTSLGLAGWLVSARDLDKAFIAAPKDFVGTMHATVKLHSAAGQLLDSQVIRFEWIERQKADLMPPLNLPETTAVVQTLHTDEIATLTELGQDLLKHGDISAARVVLKRAAAAGDVEAMVRLGMTYDPVFLAKWGVLGFSPDLVQAREWYDRAMHLGSSEASRHLERLASMPK